MDTTEVNKQLLELKPQLTKDLGIIMNNLDVLEKKGVPGYVDLRATTLEASILLKKMTEILSELDL